MFARAAMLQPRAISWLSNEFRHLLTNLSRIRRKDHIRCITRHVVRGAATFRWWEIQAYAAIWACVLGTITAWNPHVSRIWRRQLGMRFCVELEQIVRLPDPPSIRALNELIHHRVNLSRLVGDLYTLQSVEIVHVERAFETVNGGFDLIAGIMWPSRALNEMLRGARSRLRVDQPLTGNLLLLLDRVLVMLPGVPLHGYGWASEQLRQWTRGLLEETRDIVERSRLR